MRFTMRSRLSRSFEVLAKVDMFFFDTTPASRGVAKLRSSSDHASRRGGRIRPPTAFRPPLSHSRLRHSPFLDPLLKLLAAKNPLHEDAWSMNHIRIQLSRFDQMLDFSDRDLCRSCHHRIEIARRFAIDKVAPPV